MRIKEEYLNLKKKYLEYVVIIKVGTFYNVLGKDALIIKNIFNYQIKEFSGTIKVGFPITSENKVLNKLNKLKINYLIYDNETILKEKFNKNNYNMYVNNLSIDDRIKNINIKLNDIKENINILNTLDKIEEII